MLKLLYKSIVSDYFMNKTSHKDFKTDVPNLQSNNKPKEKEENYLF